MQINTKWIDYQSKIELEKSLLVKIFDIANQAIASRNVFRIVLAGGSTPENIYKEFYNTKNTDFSKWEVYIGDERCLEANDPDRNSVMVTNAFIGNFKDLSAPKFFPINTEKGSETSAKEYSELLSKIDSFDLVLLGLGEDGHTASLFPGHQWNEDQLVVPVKNAPKPPSDRVSLTPKAFSRAKKIIFIVTGNGKNDAVNQWKNNEDIPASTIFSEQDVEVHLNLD